MGARVHTLDMPTINIDAKQLSVTMSLGETLGAFKSHVEVPISHVTGAEVLDKKFWTTLGVRVPGTGAPGLMVAGTFLKKGDKAFVCWKRKDQVLQINLTGQFYDRLVIGVADAEEWAEKINAYITGC
jgi:hypothetical protein